MFANVLFLRFIDMVSSLHSSWQRDSLASCGWRSAV